MSPSHTTAQYATNTCRSSILTTQDSLANAEPPSFDNKRAHHEKDNIHDNQMNHQSTTHQPTFNLNYQEILENLVQKKNDKLKNVQNKKPTNVTTPTTMVTTTRIKRTNRSARLEHGRNRLQQVPALTTRPTGHASTSTHHYKHYEAHQSMSANAS